MAENSVLAQIKKLDEQRAKLLEDAKAEALTKANAAIADLNSLGFNYRLAEGTGSAPRSQSTGTRRSGIRDEVFNAVKNAGPDGIAPAAIRDAIGAADKQGAQSVSNALSALKKANKISDKNGSYVAA
jgi:hypothetical protein